MGVDAPKEQAPAAKQHLSFSPFQQDVMRAVRRALHGGVDPNERMQTYYAAALERTYAAADRKAEKPSNERD